MSLQFESIFIKLINSQNDELHLQRIFEGNKESLSKKPSVLMIHGSVENGRIFYSKSGKGLGSYLAKAGYDVFVGDLRGKGESTPKVSKNSTFGQPEHILEDIPAFAAKIKELKGEYPAFWVAHSWGGVLIPAVLMRFSEINQAAKRMVFFGSKRRIRTKGLEKMLKINLLWNLAGRSISKAVGYFPNTKVGFGTDDESYNFIRHSNKWIKEDKWVDEDGFDYNEALNNKSYFPPTLHIAAINDTILGNPNDVKLLQQEINNPEDEFLLLSKQNGNQVDYDHNDMLTHPKATEDHFPRVLEWLDV